MGELPSYLCVEGAEFSSYRLGQASSSSFLIVLVGVRDWWGSLATFFVSFRPA